jgi:hypothetical protein
MNEILTDALKLTIKIAIIPILVMTSLWLFAVGVMLLNPPMP